MARLVIGTSKAATTAGLVKEVKPAYYIEKGVDANGVLIPGNTLIDLTGVTGLPRQSLANAYSALKPGTSYTDDYSVITYPSFNNVDIDLSNIRLDANCIGYAFYGRTGLNSVKISTSISSDGIGSACFARSDVKSAVISGTLYPYSAAMFYKCTSLASVSIPNFADGSRGCFGNWFYGCTALTSIDFPSLEQIRAYTNSYDNSFSGCCQLCTSLVSFTMNKLVSIGAGSSSSSNLSCSYMVAGCTALQHLGLDSLESITGSYNSTRSACYQMCANCSSLEYVEFKSLATVSTYSCSQMFSGCTALESLWFYALASVGTNSFYQMLRSCTNVTVHFPKAGQATWETYAPFTAGFGGTNTTVLFDLVTSLTGADTNTYTRSEKNSTSTATAWTYNDTLYYTSGVSNHTAGVNEPTVGTTIYSDAACTTSVTTVTAIA